MTDLTITTVANRTELGIGMVDVLLTTVRQAVAQSRRALVGWPVGRSPRPIVDALLARAAHTADLDLSALVVVLMDDYLTGSATSGWERVDEHAGHSCRGAALRELIGPLNEVLPADRALSLDRLWSPDPRDPSAYDARIADAGGIDVFVVAVGSGDGHVALNPPGSDRESRTRVVALADTTRRDNLATFDSLASLADVPTHGVTVGLRTIADARTLMVVAHGEEKADAVARVVAADQFDPGFPATIIAEHPAVHLFCDAAAWSRAAADTASDPMGAQR